MVACMNARFLDDLRSIRTEQERIHRLVRRMDGWIEKLSVQTTSRPLGMPPPPLPSEQSTPPTPPNRCAIGANLKDAPQHEDLEKEALRNESLHTSAEEGRGASATQEHTCINADLHFNRPASAAGNKIPGHESPTGSGATAIAQPTPRKADSAPRQTHRPTLNRPNFPKPPAGPGADTVPPVPSTLAGGTKARAAAREDQPLEIHFGQVWLVRIGIVILLTGLVFLGNLAYQHIVPRLGPGGKLAMIALAGAALCGAGRRLERKGESLRNYGRVLFAGGCAALYYTAYAAHFVKALQVISNPIAGGLLLLTLAGGMVAVAHRRKSEPVALLAVLLSYYTSSINPIGAFTLFSSLLLTGCAMFFLVRNRWSRLTFASLLGTYASYAWWRIYGASAGGAATSVATQLSFLAGYWAIFTTGAFLTSPIVMPAAARTTFVTLNNGAFCGLGMLALLLQPPQPSLWLFPAITGAVLWALSKLTARREPDGHAMEGAYFVQGLTLMGLGLAMKLTGHQLALVFAAQSVVLITTGRRLAVLRGIAAGASVLLSFFLAWFQLLANTEGAPMSGGLVALVLAFNAWWLKKKHWPAEEVHPLALGGIIAALSLSLGSLYFGLGVQHMIPWLAVGTCALSLAAWVLRCRELAACSQWLLPFAGAQWILKADPQGSSAAGIIIAGVILALCWSRQRMLALPKDTALGYEAVPAFTAGAVGVMWLLRSTDGITAMALASGIAVSWVAGALLARSRMLAMAGCLFAAAAVFQFLVTAKNASWQVALAPTAGLLALAWLTRWLPRLGDELSVCQTEIRKGLVWPAITLIFPWAFIHIQNEWQALFFATVGMAGVAAGRRAEWMTLSGLALGCMAAVVMLARFSIAPTWQHLLVVLAFPAVCRWARRDEKAGPLVESAPTMAWTTSILLTFWVLRADYVYEWKTGPTVLFALLALALFPAGLALRERA